MTPAVLHPSLLTTAEAAEMLRVAPGTLANWRHRRFGPPWVKFENGTVRYRKPDVAQYIADRLIAPERTVTA